jgi:hypothetical protein
MVYDELEMLQSLQHPHIVSFVDWFESKVSELRTKELRKFFDYENRTNSTLSPN